MFRLVLLLVLGVTVTADTICGEEMIWPVPYESTFGKGVVQFKSWSDLSVTVTPKSSIVTDAFKLLQNYKYSAADSACGPIPTSTTPTVSTLHIRLLTTGYQDSVWATETYNVTISSTHIAMTAGSEIGAIRGLATLAQLTRTSSDMMCVQGTPVWVEDFPEYSYRSVMLDTARRFQPLDNIRTVIDGMFWSKLRVLHLHTYDDQSNPLLSNLLGSAGAYINKQTKKPEVYTKQDILDLQMYARTRGVVIVPEFDMPGHIGSWGAKESSIISCNGRRDGSYNNNHYAAEAPAGALNIYDQKAYSVVHSWLVEMKDWFKYTDVWHLGADELFLECYNVTSKDKHFYEVLQKFIDFTQSTVIGFGKTPVMWEDLITRPQYAGKLNWTYSQTMVQSWGLSPTSCATVHKYGLRCIISPYQHTYLDCGIGDGPEAERCGGKKIGTEAHPCKQWCPWNSPEHIYKFGFLQDGKIKGVVGGGSLLWTERVMPHVQSELMWPRAAIAGERLWSLKTYNSPFPYARVEFHAARLKMQGIDVAPTVAWTPSPTNGFRYFQGNLSQWCNVDSFTEEQCKKMM